MNEDGKMSNGKMSGILKGTCPWKKMKILHIVQDPIIFMKESEDDSNVQ